MDRIGWDRRSVDAMSGRRREVEDEASKTMVGEVVRHGMCGAE